MMRSPTLRRAILFAAAIASLGLTIGSAPVLPVSTKSGRVCDVERDITVSDSTSHNGQVGIPWDVSSDGCTHTLGILNAAFSRVGHGNGARGGTSSPPNAIYDPVYIAGKTWYSLPGITIPGVGGQILTGGGQQYVWFDVQRGAGLSSETNIVFNGGSSGTSCVNYTGWGWHIGALNFFAWPILTNQNYTDLGNAVNPYNVRRTTGFDVSGTSNAVGQLDCDGMTFTGFTDAIHVSASVTNGDRLHWHYVATNFCNHLLHCENQQCVCSSIDNVSSYTAHDSLFKFDTGGDFTVNNTCAIEGAGGTLLEVNGDLLNSPRLTFHGVRVDNRYDGHALGEKLVKLGTGALNCTIVIDGEYNNGEALDGYPTDPLVVLPGGWDASTLAAKHIVIRLDVNGISPTTAALYPR